MNNRILLRIIFFFPVFLSLFLFDLYPQGSQLQSEINYYPFRKGDKWGLSDKNRQLITPLQWDDVRILYDGIKDSLLAVKKNGKWGVVNLMTAKEVISLFYDDISTFQDGMFFTEYILVEKENKQGLLGHDGEILIPIRFDLIGNYYNGIASVKINSKWDFTDKTGKLVNGLKYDEIGNSYNGITCVWIDDKFGYVNSEGKEIISPELENELSKPINTPENGIIAVYKNGKYGFYDTTGQIIVPLIYDDIWPFYTGVGAVKQKNHWALVNSQGNFITPFIYDSFESCLESLVRFSRGGKHGFVDSCGTELYDAEYDDIYWFAYGESIFKVKKNGKYGIVNFKGEILVPIKYNFLEFANCVNFPRIICNYENNFGIIDTLGKIIVPFKYDKIYNLSCVNKIKINGKEGFIDPNGYEIIPPQGDTLLNGMIHGLAINKKNGKYGFISYGGREVLPPIYKGYYWDDEFPLIAVRKDSLFAFFDTLGTPLTEFKYTGTLPYLEDKRILGVKIGNYYGAINAKGVEIIPVEYDYNRGAERNMVIMIKNQRRCYFGWDGTKYYED